MKAQELRIGNWVELDDEFTQMVCIMEDNTEWINPIPLTEEWLEQFGFSKIQSNDTLSYIYTKSHKEAFIVLEDDMSVAVTCTEILFYKESQYGYYAPSVDRTKYVHQLQNLYFALTGEELEIKSDD